MAKKGNEISDVVAERMVLAEIIQSKSPDIITNVFLQLSSGDFANRLNRDIFDVCNNMYNEGIIISKASILSTFTNIGILNEVSPDYIDCLFNIESDENYQHYVDQIKSFSTKRRLEIAAKKITTLAQSNEIFPVDKLISEAESYVSDATPSYVSTAQAFKLGDDALDRFLSERLDRPRGMLGHSCGFPTLDRIFSGLVPKRLYVFAGRQGVGKSALALNMAKSLTFDQNLPGLIIDTENDRSMCEVRLLSLLSGVDKTSIETGFFGKDGANYEGVMGARELLRSKDLYHINMVEHDIKKLDLLCRKHVELYGIKYVIYDFIRSDIVDDNFGGKEYQVLGEITKSLQAIGNKYNISVIMMAQLNRPNPGSRNDVLGSERIAGSDRIGWFADAAVGIRKLTPNEINKFDGVSNINRMLDVMKNRHGNDDVPPIPVFYEGHLCRMNEGELNNGKGTNNVPYEDREDRSSGPWDY